jgi:4-hydroxy-tetrahydrodipicolinate reductase
MCQEIMALLTEEPQLIAGPFFITGPENGELSLPEGLSYLMAPLPLSLNNTETELVTQAKKTGAIVIDFTTPEAALANASWYCRNDLPFVMGTTGFNQQQMVDLVSSSKINAVIAPNMAAPIVALMAGLRWATEQFPGVLEGFTLSGFESHQSSKKDKSGTGLKIVELLAQLGANATPQQLRSVREQSEQLSLGIPSEHLTGHGWHRYQLTNDTEQVALALEHHINGRSLYAAGALKAAAYLSSKRDRSGQVFSMLDVLKNT